MRIVTLTTDMGNSDYYTGALRGGLLSHCEGITLIDIATLITPHDIRQGAYALRAAYRYFPTGTIHLLYINAPEADGNLIVIEFEGHFFITLDQGAVSMLFASLPVSSYFIQADSTDTSAFSILAISKVINAILSGTSLPDIGTTTHPIRQLRWMLPSATEGNIQGHVAHLDKYGNAITNITREMYQKYIGDKRFAILFSGMEVNVLQVAYSDVAQGLVVCFFNYEGFLEIAIYKGNAQKLFALKIHSPVIITHL